MFCVSGFGFLSVFGLEMWFDAFGVDQGELFEGFLPVRGDGALDKSSGGFALIRRLASFLGPFTGSFVLDIADRQPQEFHRGSVIGEMATRFRDFTQLVVQRLNRVGSVNNSP